MLELLEAVSARGELDSTHAEFHHHFVESLAKCPCSPFVIVLTGIPLEETLAFELVHEINNGWKML